MTYLPVQKNGIIDLAELEAAIRPDTSLVSIMTVNNETGVIQPIKEIGALVRRHRGVYLHTDAAQATGKIAIDVNEMNVDLMSISGHKLYGPKGIGAAYVRRRPRVRLEPIISGGGQERGLRSGTLATPLVVGLGEAARIAKQEMTVSALPSRCLDDTLHVLLLFCELCGELLGFARRRLSRDLSCRGTEPLSKSYEILELGTDFTLLFQRDHARIKELSDRLIAGINAKVEHVIRNGDLNGYPGCVNLSFAYVEGESLLMALKVCHIPPSSPLDGVLTEPCVHRTLRCHPVVHALPRRWSRHMSCVRSAPLRTWHTRPSALVSAALPPRPRSTTSSTKSSRWSSDCVT